jgi:hypothetical protein
MEDRNQDNKEISKNNKNNKVTIYARSNDGLASQFFFVVYFGRGSGMGQAGCDRQRRNALVHCGGTVGTAGPIAAMLAGYANHLEVGLFVRVFIRKLFSPARR